MQLGQMQLRITKHAHEQYCGRVEEIDIDRLREQIISYLVTGECEKQEEYIQIHDVWWVCDIHGDTITLVTCYGRSTIDLPRAVKWAQRYRDRIDLDHLPYIATHSLA